ncbi:hypothetical protein [Sporomusa aerivorans]|uniref:hypothetical protein n=1 Tax=Sporomusa aerivorans TaxID=204936 RepID=UPI00352A50BA
MFELILGIMAVMSAMLHFGFINRYNNDEITKSISCAPLGPTHKYPMQNFCCLLLDYAGPQQGKSLATYCLGAVWILYYIYHFMVCKLFPPMLLLNLTNIMATVLTSAYFLESLYKVSSSPDFDKWFIEPSHNLLYSTVIYWEFILSGIVVMSLILNNNHPV